MPYPSQVTTHQIVDVAHDVIDKDGPSKFSRARLAAKLGVRAPSLYRYFPNMEALLQAVNLRTLEALFSGIRDALEGSPDDPAQRLRIVAESVRDFARAHSHGYEAAMTAQVHVTRPDEDLLVHMVLPLQNIMAELTGPERSPRCGVSWPSSTASSCSNSTTSYSVAAIWAPRTRLPSPPILRAGATTDGDAGVFTLRFAPVL